MNHMISLKQTKIFKNQSGFTLIEMIAAIVLLGIMGLFSIQFISGAAETNRLIAGQKGLLDDAKLAMEFMIREVRLADPTNTSIAFTASSITFDKFSGLAVDTDFTQISYSLVGNTIVRTSSNSTTTLADQVTGFTVAQTIDTTTLSEFYTFTIVLAGANGTNFTLTSGVRPRGLIS